MQPQARRAGLPFSPFPEPPEDELEAAWSPVFSLPLEKQDEHVVREVFAGCHARAALPGTLELIERWGAELVVRESAEFSGAIAAERLGVPSRHRRACRLPPPPTGSTSARPRP